MPTPRLPPKIMVVASQVFPLTERAVLEALPNVVSPVADNVPSVEILVPMVVAALMMPTQARVARMEIVITLVMPPPIDFLMNLAYFDIVLLTQGKNLFPNKLTS